MASKAFASTSLLLITLNLVFFTLVSSTYCPPPPTPKPKPPSHAPKPKSPPPSPKLPKSPPSSPKSPKSSPPVKPISSPPPPPKQETCPRDALKLGVCANVLGVLTGVVVGTPPKEPCCTLLEGLADLEAAVCLCTAIKANVLGLNLNVGVDLSLLLNNCGKELPTGFICA